MLLIKSTINNVVFCFNQYFLHYQYLNLVIWIVITSNTLKGALDNFSLIPRFFFKKVEIFIPLEVYTYVVTARLILLATPT